MFSQIIENLISTANMTEKEIGDLVGASQATVNRIRRGKQQPYYNLGSALLQLHKQKCPQLEVAA